MQDLNDLYYFAEVVTHGGFAPASRALRQPKSKLSRRIAQLEARLGVRLIERSTRRFRVTEVGDAFYARCRSMLLEAEAAEAVAAETLGEPRGLVRFSCPTGMLEPIRAALTACLARHPGVCLHVLATNRPVDLIEERIDVALRVRTTLDTDASLTMRTLARSRRVLVASPAVAATIGTEADVTVLASTATLSPADTAGEDVWSFTGPNGESRSVRHRPRLSCSEFHVLREAAAAGLGVALLPDHACREDLRAGRLVQVFPAWRMQEGIVHLVFTARRGLPPAVRAFIDHLAERFREDERLSDSAFA